jgi:hypothetical protein
MPIVRIGVGEGIDDLSAREQLAEETMAEERRRLIVYGDDDVSVDQVGNVDRCDKQHHGDEHENYGVDHDHVKEAKEVAEE